MSLPVRWVSIDPGDAHVGLTSWEGSTPVKCIETSPDGVMDLLETLTKHRTIETVVCEKWLLYPQKAREMIWSEFETCQLIGAIKRLCKTSGVVYVGQLASQGKSTYKTGWYKEMSLTDRRQLPWWGVSKADHPKDSWAHGRYYIKQQTGAW